MTESNFKRKVVALTVGAVLLLIILISVMVYQLVSIGVEKKREKQYLSDTAEYERLIEESRDVLEARSAKWWIERRARELGRIKADDEILESIGK